MPGHSLLTPREQAVFELVCEGHASKEIAARLGMRPATVKTHLCRVYKKRGVQGARELIAGYWREKLAALETTNPQR